MARGGWSKPLAGFVDQSREKLMVNMMAASEQASRDVIYASPKDTSRYLANHNFSVNEPDESFDESRRDVSRNDALANARRAIAALRPGDVFYVVNTTPYGEFLEYGTSRMAPYAVYTKADNNLREKYG